MAASKSIVLITGANGGIGFELAVQLLADASKHVLLGSRSAEKGTTALKDLQSRSLSGSIELLQVDVSNEDSIKAAAQAVEGKHGRLDALVNNAGIADADGQTLSERMLKIYATNVIGPELMGIHFAPLLRKSTGTPRIINVSSGQGSISRRLDPQAGGYNVRGLPYRASKAAMNMVNAEQVYEYGKDGFKIFAYCPGFTVSNLSQMNKAENNAKPTSAAAAPMVAILNGESDSYHATLMYEGGTYNW